MSTTWPGLSFWVAFGMGKNFQLLLTPFVKAEMPFAWQAFTKCDTTSALRKTSVWEAWKVYPEATEAFLFVNDSSFLPLEINTPVFDVLQRFVVMLYDS